MIAALIMEIVTFVLGIGAMNMFIGEESLQTAGMGMYISLRAEDYEAASKMLTQFMKIRVMYDDFLVGYFQYFNLAMAPAFLEFGNASRAMEDVYAKRIVEGFTKQNLPLQSKIRISSQPSGAKIYLYTPQGTWEDTGKTTPETITREGPQTQRILLSRYDSRKKYHRQKIVLLSATAGAKIEYAANLYVNPYKSTTGATEYAPVYAHAGAVEP